MNNNPFTGWQYVFKFTLLSNLRNKSYKLFTVITAIVLLAGISLIMIGIGAPKDEVVDSTKIKTVIVVDGDSGINADYSVLNYSENKLFNSVVYKRADGDVFSAIKEASGENKYELVVSVEKTEDNYSVTVITPDETALTSDDVSNYADFLTENYLLVLVSESGLDINQIQTLYSGFKANVVYTDGIKDELAEAREIFAIVIRFVCVLLLYFPVLIYGMNVAGSVVMEKSSKLMELFLVSIKPAAMVVGKTLATSLTALIQITVIIGAAAGGFFIGTTVVNAINPENDMILMQIFKTIGGMSDLFSIPSIIVAFMILLCGFLLYCSLAAFGGALASRTEDVASASQYFTLLLCISYLFSMKAAGDGIGDMTWLTLFPFTSVLIVPASVVIGEVSILNAVFSVIIILVTALAIMYLSGKVYAMTMFYRGGYINIKQLIAMFKASSNKSK